MRAIYQIIQLIHTLVNFYETLIFVYVLLSWFPIRQGGLLYDIGSVLQSICEPYLSIFRRFIPPIGGIDFSPVVAIFALEAIAQLVISILV